MRSGRMAKRVVLLVGPVPPPVHGVTISTRRLLASSLSDEFKIVHLDTSDHRTTTNIGAFDFTNIFLGLKNYVEMIGHCLRHRPDVVYIPVSQTSLGFLRDSGFVFLPKLLSRSKVVIHLRGGYFGKFYECAPKAIRLYIDRVMKMVDRVIVLGDVFRPIFHRWLSDDRIDTAPNGTDLVVDNIDSKSRRMETGPVTVTYMSNLIPSKGIMEFIRAAAQVAAERNDVLFKIAGNWWGDDAVFRREVETASKTGELTMRLEMVGPVRGDAKTRLLFDTDVFILPTYYPFEGHPNAIVEAMAAGCVVIGTDHAAIPETVIDGETGFIVPCRCVEPIRDAITNLVKDRRLLRKMAQASYQRYQRHYTVDRNVAMLAASFRRACAAE